MQRNITFDSLLDDIILNYSFYANKDIKDEIFKDLSEIASKIDAEKEKAISSKLLKILQL